MTSQVAVRLDDRMLRELDWLVDRCEFDSRAEAIRAALVVLVQRERDREIDERITAAYSEAPSTPDEAIRPDLSVWDELDDEDWSGWQ